MEIVDFSMLSETQITQAAQMLTDELHDGWPALTNAMKEINELRNGDPDSLLLAAVDQGDVIGWAGLLPGYGKMFELHPLVVRGDRQRKGVGVVPDAYGYGKPDIQMAIRL